MKNCTVTSEYRSQMFYNVKSRNYLNKTITSTGNVYKQAETLNIDKRYNETLNKRADSRLSYVDFEKSVSNYTLTKIDKYTTNCLEKEIKAIQVINALKHMKNDKSRYSDYSD